MAFNMEGGSMDSSSNANAWELEPMAGEEQVEAGRVMSFQEEIDAWRREHGMDMAPDGQRLDILGGGERGDWIVNAQDQSQARAAEGMMSDESKGWTLQ